MNGDGAVDVYDMTGMRSAAVNGDAERFDAADINMDGAIDENYLRLLVSFLKGEIKSF